jgi:endonuclease/exonuclease/phosphatase family metal-dependent hydrolase
MGPGSARLSHHHSWLELWLKFLIWNLENFFLTPHLKSAYNQSLKPQNKSQMIVKIIDEYAPEVLFLCEVGGVESLDLLAKQIKGEYLSFYTEGNSDRGIGLGFLIKKDYCQVQFHTHKNFKLPPITLEDKNYPRSFSRDAAELWLCDQQMNPKLIIWGVHLKSAQDRQGGDFRGARQRAAEIRGLVQLVKMRQEQFGNIPQWLAGDFNGQAYGPKVTQEFEHLAAQLPGHHDLLERLDLPQEERWSFVINHNGGIPTQLDYLFLPEQTPTPKVSESGVIQLWQHIGTTPGPASSASERALWPSDHLPLFALWETRPF